MFLEAAFCSLLTCCFSPVVSLPPFAERSAFTCWLMPFCCFSDCVSFPPLAERSARVSPLIAASFDSRLAVSPAVSCPLFTPCAMRSCWFSLRCAIVGFCAGVVLGVLDPCEAELPEPLLDPLADGSCASASVPSSSTAAGTIVHFENLLLMTESPFFAFDLNPLDTL